MKIQPSRQAWRPEAGPLTLRRDRQCRGGPCALRAPQPWHSHAPCQQACWTTGMSAPVPISSNCDRCYTGAGIRCLLFIAASSARKACVKPANCGSPGQWQEADSADHISMKLLACSFCFPSWSTAYTHVLLLQLTVIDTGVLVPDIPPCCSCPPSELCNAILLRAMPFKLP